jgi:glycolate oxidase iron-sulfur subunit
MRHDIHHTLQCAVDDASVDKGLMSCVHCGFCLDACPTYRLTGDESDSPRGRLALMRGVHEDKLSLSGPEANAPGGVGYHLDRCLGCRSCETACPSGVPYGELLEHFRDDQEAQTQRTLGDSLLRKSLLMLLTSPQKLRFALSAGRITGGRIPAPAAAFVGLPSDTRLPIPQDLAAASASMPIFTPAVGAKRGAVVLLTGCVMSVLYSPVHAATVFVLAQNGYDVHCPGEQGCCGALHGHQGALADAKVKAKGLIDQIDGLDVSAIILNSAGCGSFIKDFHKLLAHEERWTDRATAFVSKVRDISEFLDEVGPVPMTHPVDVRATYHDACHLRHGQRIADAPRRLLRGIPSLNLIECADPDQCCGSAGVYNYLEPEIAASVLSAKLDTLLATRAELIVTANPGCLAWIDQGIAKRAKQGLLSPGTKAPDILHPVQIYAKAYGFPS